MEDLDEPVQAGAEDELAPFRDDEPDQPEDAAEQHDDGQDKPEDDREDDPDDEPKGHYKVTYKDEHGNDVEQKVTYEELTAGYLKGRDVETVRQASEAQIAKAYEEASEQVSKHTQHVQQTLATHERLLMQVLGLAEDAGLSADPNEAVQMMQRRDALSRALNQTRYAMHAEAQKALVDDQKAIAKAQGVLTTKGLSPDKVTALFQQISTAYGVSAQALVALRDPGLVLALKDALDHRSLQAKRPEVSKKVREAPPLPPSKTRKAPVADDLVKRLRSKGAKGTDLEEYFKRIG